MTAAITDFAQYSDLRRSAENNDPEVLREVAGQFEALFVQTMLKSMRDTSLADPIFGQSEQHEMYQDMLDKQYALEMSSGKGIGLADMLVRQLGGSHSAQKTSEVNGMALARHTAARQTTNGPAWSEPDQFVRDIWPHAKEAADQLKVAPEGLLAQAALETGWGKHVMRKPNGTNSFNLFGIKASSSWSGPSTSKPTIEFRDGISQRETARFRAYPDIEATFADYVEVVGTQPRFDSVRNHGDDIAAFAEALQESGYATDPAYADKITAIVNSDTMRSALAELKSTDSPPIKRERIPGESI